MKGKIREYLINLSFEYREQPVPRAVPVNVNDRETVLRGELREPECDTLEIAKILDRAMLNGRGNLTPDTYRRRAEEELACYLVRAAIRRARREEG